MAKKKKEAQPAEPKQEVQTPPKPPKQANPLLTLAIILLVLVGVGELSLVGYYGFSSFRYNRALRLYEAEQQAAAEERAAQGITAGSAYGPNLKVENGRVTWQREEKLSLGSTSSSATADQTAGQTQAGSQNTLCYAVPRIPYLLAKQETEVQSPVQGAESLGGGASTPT